MIGVICLISSVLSLCSLSTGFSCRRDAFASARRFEEAVLGADFGVSLSERLSRPVPFAAALLQMFPPFGGVITGGDGVGGGGGDWRSADGGSGGVAPTTTMRELPGLAVLPGESVGARGTAADGKLCDGLRSTLAWDWARRAQSSASLNVSARNITALEGNSSTTKCPSLYFSNPPASVSPRGTRNARTTERRGMTSLAHGRRIRGGQVSPFTLLPEVGCCSCCSIGRGNAAKCKNSVRVIMK